VGPGVRHDGAAALEADRRGMGLKAGEEAPQDASLQAFGLGIGSQDAALAAAAFRDLEAAITWPHGA